MIRRIRGGRWGGKTRTREQREKMLGKAQGKSERGKESQTWEQRQERLDKSTAAAPPRKATKANANIPHPAGLREQRISKGLFKHYILRLHWRLDRKATDFQGSFQTFSISSRAFKTTDSTSSSQIFYHFI